MRGKTSEHKEQVAYFQWVDLMAKQDSRYLNIFAIPNGGLRNIVTAAKMKKEGVRKGVPDIAIMFPAQGYHGMFLELKIKPNKPSKEQEEWIDRLMRSAYFATVCWSTEELIQTTEWYMS